MHGTSPPVDAIDALVAFAVARLGHRYDMKNVFDLARYLLPTPPVQWCRRTIALGGGDPTRAICSRQPGTRCPARFPCWSVMNPAGIVVPKIAF